MTNGNDAAGTGLETKDICVGGSTQGPVFEKDTTYHRGLTKREYFAAMAMQGLLSCPHDSYGYKTKGGLSLERNAVRIADATIAALNETK